MPTDEVKQNYGYTPKAIGEVAATQIEVVDATDTLSDNVGAFGKGGIEAPDVTVIEDNPLDEGMNVEEVPDESSDMSETPFDDVGSKQKLIDWASDDQGNIAKKPLMKYFLDVDGGPGQSPLNYRYPVGAITNGSDNPQYCPIAMDHSWDLASGKKTGVVNRGIQKKIVLLKQREGYPLNDEQNEFTQRHMSIPEIRVQYNAAERDSGVLNETDDYIDVSVIPMREGVFTGTDGIPTLKQFDVFKGDAHWLEGQPILHGHTGPTEIVTYKHHKLGKLLNVTPREETKDVSAVARYYKNKLTPDDIAKIKSETPYDGSIAYTTNTVPEEGDWISPSGEKQHYNAVEKDGYHFYHFAEVGEGACSVGDGCGFLLNEAGMKLDGNFWEPAVQAYLEKLNNELVMAEDDAEKKRLTAEIARWTKLQSRLGGKQNSAESQSLSEENIMVKEQSKEPVDPVIEEVAEVKEDAKGKGTVTDKQGNECLPFEMKGGKCPKDAEMTDETAKANEAPKEKSVQVEVTIPEEFAQKMNAAISENEALKSKLEETTVKMNEMATKVEELIQKQNETEEMNRQSLEKRDFDAFCMRLNAANRTPEKAKEHYEAFKQEGWAYFDANPKILNTGVPLMKAMGVPSSSGESKVEEAKKRVHMTLNSRRVLPSP